MQVPVRYNIELYKRNEKSSVYRKYTFPLEKIFIFTYRIPKLKLGSLTSRDINPKSVLPCYATGITHRVGISDSSFNIAKLNVKEINS